MKQIFAASCGVLPDTKEDCTAKFASLIRENPAGARIEFSQGVYQFSAQNALHRSYHISNSDPAAQRNVSILLENCRDLTLDFAGSTLLFSGQTIALALSACENVTIRNAKIDWDVPFTAEGRIVEASETQIAAAIDPQRFAHHVDGGRLFFDGPGWTSAYFGAMEFDSDTKLVREGAGDTIGKVTASMREDGAVLLDGAFSPVPRVGNFLVLRHGARIHPGLFCQNSSSITLQNMTFYSTCGLGALFQFTKDITVERVSFEPNCARGRQVSSSHDDGLHFSNCAGKIAVSHCRFRGLMDDAINVHGTSARIDEADGKTVCGRFCHPQSVGFSHWAKAGDTIAFLKSSTLNTVSTARVRSFALMTPETFELELDETVPDAIRAGDALENLTNTPAFDCCENDFGSGRARGVLVTTPQPVRIVGNRFETSGAAILLCGDANAWYESGACRDVEICENTFAAHCLTSSYQFCGGVISIAPEIANRAESEGFHRNLRIHGNTFFCPARPLLYAHCAKDVTFAENTIHGGQDEPTILSTYSEITDEKNRTIF